MAKKKTKRKTTKRLPKTIRVWVPVEVRVEKGKVKTYLGETENSQERPSAGDREQAHENMVGYSEPYGDPAPTAQHVVWIEATIPVPQVAKSATVKGRVV